ncbi:trafficking protein particle complex subunit 1 [Striga asiatica]|uniref:Trafficking protein particle complex subunit n=1 Tax=Striga asiatica TaxID=4170 RepID=A0A5A7QV39_STRAF|nr:trafficking protein particle complex subunit 1 [Striga asiatica]
MSFEGIKFRNKITAKREKHQTPPPSLCPHYNLRSEPRGESTHSAFPVSENLSTLIINPIKSVSQMQFFGGTEISPSPPAPTASGNNAHMLYIFNRNGVCLLYREWNRPLKTLSSQQDHKLMFGLLFSLKSLTAKMDPTSAEKGNLGVPQLPGQGCSFHSFRTNTYKLSFMESPSGIKVG